MDWVLLQKICLAFSNKKKRNIVGISTALCKALLQEHSFKPFSGDFAVLGRQTTAVTEQEAERLISQYGVLPANTQHNPQGKISNSGLTLVQRDQDTRAASGMDWITEKSFFSMFSSAKITTFDVTDYEHCDIVHDFTKPVPPELLGKYDACWLGSCLDNISDPFAALKNGADLLKPGGRLIDFEICTSDIGAYLAYPPGFFMDWLAVNKFENVRLYLMVFSDRNLFNGPWHLYSLDSHWASYNQVDFRALPYNSFAVCYWVADKGLNSQEIQAPVQGQYRNQLLNLEYDETFSKWFNLGKRPLLSAECNDIGLKKIVRKSVVLTKRASNKILHKVGLDLSFKINKFTVPDLKGFTYLGLI
jgi:hypothetical protein